MNYKRKSSDKQIDDVIYKAEHDGFGLNEEELDEYMEKYPFGSGGSNPIGTIIAFMGNAVPKDYLVCDGKEYFIEEYPKLANFFDKQFGASNHFGGDGQTTFAVPDLRGEFLRGTNLNDENDSSGVHTNEGLPEIEGEFIPWWNNAAGFYAPQFSGALTEGQVTRGRITGEDYNVHGGNSIIFKASYSNSIYGNSNHVTPTNTSVLYCIKATISADEEEPGEAVTMDELNTFMSSYLIDHAINNGANPIGTVISFMGNVPPTGYLTCDGAEYPIVDYPQLAKFFKDQFGSEQYFGGTGANFCVPDLRGEFLRGTGTNSHTNQGNGETVGVHQDGTEHLRSTLVSATGEYFIYSTNEQYVGQLKQDSFIGVTTKQDRLVGTMQSVTQSNRYTSRPTNTSVLYCIKAEAVTINDLSEKQAFISYLDYSTDEKCVGRWINGKPLYQKIIPIKLGVTSTRGTGADTYFPIGAIIDTIVSVQGFVKGPNAAGLTAWINVNTGYLYNTGLGGVFITATGNENEANAAIKNHVLIRNQMPDWNNIPGYAIVKYTKVEDPENSFTLKDLDNFKLITGPANNYSYEEQVVGTWVDGKPLYQRTVTGTTTTPGTWKVLFTQPGIRIVDCKGYILCSNSIYTPITYDDFSRCGVTIHYNCGEAIHIRVKPNDPLFINCPVVATIQYIKTTD